MSSTIFKSYLYQFVHLHDTHDLLFQRWLSSEADLHVCLHFVQFIEIHTKLTSDTSYAKNMFVFLIFYFILFLVHSNQDMLSENKS